MEFDNNDEQFSEGLKMILDPNHKKAINAPSSDFIIKTGFADKDGKIIIPPQWELLHLLRIRFQWLNVLMSQAYYNEAAPQVAKDMVSSFDIYTPTVSLIQKGQKNGTIREGSSLALAMAYWCAIQGIAEQLALNPNLPCPEGEWIIDIIRRKSQ